MAIEKERKFIFKKLLTNLSLEESLENDFGDGLFLQQAYIMLAEGRELRVRIINSESAFLCYKEKINKEERHEFEYEIPLEDGKHLFATAPYSLEKIRYKTKFNGNNVDIDLYSSGLTVVEIEFEGELNELPEYCGEEITGVKEYSNIEIAMVETEKRADVVFTSTEDENILKATVTQSDGSKHFISILAIPEDKIDE